jgi:hypothetical protein
MRRLLEFPSTLAPVRTVRALNLARFIDDAIRVAESNPDAVQHLHNHLRLLVAPTRPADAIKPRRDRRIVADRRMDRLPSGSSARPLKAHLAGPDAASRQTRYPRRRI